jgi:uncharacterized phage protein (TIGR01671 family)
MNNREIKFRIWDKIGKVYRGNLYKYLINADTGELEVWAFSDIYDEWYNTHEGDEHLVVQQYTGLKDSKGVEIYEGDIIQALPAPRKGMGIDQSQYDYMLLRTPKIVLYVNGSFRLFDKIPQSYSSLVDYYYIDADMEIIGNFFENPELITNNE